jgi:predicted esterase
VVIARALLLALTACAGSAHAEPPLATTEHSATLASLFPPEEAAELSKTLPLDQPVKFRVWLSEAKNSGVLIFVSPTDSGEPAPGWLPLLQQKQLSWIAADGFGNQKLSAQRVLAVMMARELIRQTTAVAAKRTYLGGMSGGGRIASETATRFPQWFSGALYIVGANYWMPKDARLRQRAAGNRYVFITGEKDFNRSEMKRVFSRYQSNGLSASLLMDLPGFAHQYPDAGPLGQAIDFLDAR